MAAFTVSDAFTVSGLVPGLSQVALPALGHPATYNHLMYQKRRIGIAALLALGLMVAGCADGIDWSDREIRNGENILASLASVSEAARVANAADSEARFEQRRDELLGHLRRAHLLASNVDTIVLEKLHPRMYSKFRLTYQRALAKMISAYEKGNMDAAERAAADIQDFMNWFRQNRHTFRWWDESLE